MMSALTRLFKPALGGLLFLTALSAQAIDWRTCASEGQTCTIPQNQPVIVRYGSASTAYFYYSMAGVPKFKCGNFNGDPSPTVGGKSCAYSADTLLGFTDNSILLTPIAAEGKTVSGTSNLRWVHYGLPKSTTNNNKGTWWNTIQAETWKCTNSAMNYDPTQGQPPKSCYEGMPVSVQLGTDKVTPAWRECGSENGTCTIAAGLKGSPIVLRYGVGSNWTYRIATLNNDTVSIKCQTSTFDVDPISQNKFCEYVPIIPKAGATIGQWTKIIDTNCGSSGLTCGNQIALTVGTDYSTSNTKSSEWSKTVSASINYGGILGIGASVGVSSSYGGSTSYTAALTSSKSEEKTSNCATTQPGRLVAYQFSTTTSANCLKDGACNNTTSTLDVQCVMNPPPGYNGPQCLPGYCGANDPLCLADTCQYPVQ